jgi:hypothetical protein
MTRRITGKTRPVPKTPKPEPEPPEIDWEESENAYWASVARKHQAIQRTKEREVNHSSVYHTFRTHVAYKEAKDHGTELES